MSVVKQVLELLYFLAGTFTALIAFLALKQIKVAQKQLEVSKKSLETNSQREAAVFTAKQCDFFATQVVPEYDQIIAIYIAKGIDKYNLPEDKRTIFEIDFSEWFNKNGEKVNENSEQLYGLIISLLNKIEIFSIYFTHQISDLNIAYYPTARIFITILETISPFISKLRAIDPQGFSNTLLLYNIWKKMQQKEILEVKSKDISKQYLETKSEINSIKIPNIKPLGLDD